MANRHKVAFARTLLRQGKDANKWILYSFLAYKSVFEVMDDEYTTDIYDDSVQERTNNKYIELIGISKSAMALNLNLSRKQIIVLFKKLVEEKYIIERNGVLYIGIIKNVLNEGFIELQTLLDKDNQQICLNGYELIIYSWFASTSFWLRDTMKQDGGVTMSENALAKKFGLEKERFRYYLNRLEKRGLIKRRNTTSINHIGVLYI